MRIKGKKITYALEQKKLPNGKKVFVDVITHPGATLIIPYLEADKIIFLKQYRPVIGKYLYELPAGTLDKGETPLSCAARELIEETGFSAKKWKKLGQIFPVPGYSTEIIYIFKAEQLTSQCACCESDEIIETLPLTKKEILRLFKSGRIQDAKTICALAFCDFFGKINKSMV